MITRPHIHMVQSQMEHAVLIKRVLELVVPHRDAPILVLPGWPVLRFLPTVRHHQEGRSPRARVSTISASLSWYSLATSLWRNMLLVLVHIGAHVPEVILPLLDLLVVPEGPELTPPQGIGHHVGAYPEGQLPDLVLPGPLQTAPGSLPPWGWPADFLRSAIEKNEVP